ncbi:MAG: peptidyl-prolyl cis-trans isomerase [Desulfovibrionales bacterium]|jgi:peptidyl-prolyl cis-trans isomerase B (cyclophilin B)|nr:peptidyl-prolyl cis-trans isomerase [Desulfovibrionales bacterium]
MSNPHVLLETSQGDILIELFEDKAPKTVENFLAYVDAGHYDGTIFHRIVRNFVSQGGGYTMTMERKPTREPIQNEAGNGLSNTAGTVAMARLPEPHSASDQFYLNAADNTMLDHTDDTDAGFGYCVFGRIAEGLDVAKKINWKVVKNVGPFQDFPVEPVVIVSAKRFE